MIKETVPAMPSPRPLHPVASGKAVGILDRIAESDIHLALWNRARPASLDWLDDLDWNAIDDIRLKIEGAGRLMAIAAALAETGYPEDERSQAFRDEIVSLAGHFTRVTACHRLRIRLEVVETDACRKFHADMVTARLLTTLSGPATQWIEAASPDAVQNMRTGDVALFKGRLWTDRPAILHRSPPLGRSGMTRLLLVIDPVHDNDAPATLAGEEKP